MYLCISLHLRFSNPPRWDTALTLRIQRLLILSRAENDRSTAALRPLGNILLYYKCISGMHDEYKALMKMIKSVYQHDSGGSLRIV